MPAVQWLTEHTPAARLCAPPTAIYAPLAMHATRSSQRARQGKRPPALPWSLPTWCPTPRGSRRAGSACPRCRLERPTRRGARRPGVASPAQWGQGQSTAENGSKESRKNTGGQLSKGQSTRKTIPPPQRRHAPVGDPALAALLPPMPQPGRAPLAPPPTLMPVSQAL